MSNIHASCVAIGKRGILIRGPSGSGKSTLALQLIDSEGHGLGNKPLRGHLVSDDQTILENSNGRLLAKPPIAIAGLIEIRGLGIQQVKFTKSAQVKLLVDLRPATEIERLPSQSDKYVELEGIKIPHIAIAIGNPAAAAIVRSALYSIA